MIRSAVAAPASGARRAAAWLDVLWRFSRPHTIVGTTVSILGIYVIAADSLPGLGLGDGVGDLCWTLLAGLAVNVYIVGLNQLEDVEIDRVNKPFLPLAAGDMTREAAWAVVAGCGVLSLVLAVTQGTVELVSVLAALLVGTAYSSPPLRLKRYPVLASLSISGVRALVVNLGVYAHFSGSLGEGGAIPAAVWALTLFVLPFSFAIAVLKDVPDADGDRRFSVMTFTVRLGGRRVLGLGLAALAVAYGGMAVLGPLLVDTAQPVVLSVTHALALGLLWHWSRGVDPSDREAFTRFYMRVWKLFFLEYAIVPLACVLG